MREPLNESTDARRWAEELNKEIAKQTHNAGVKVLLDQDWLATWFHNSILAGASAEARKPFANPVPVKDEEVKIDRLRVPITPGVYETFGGDIVTVLDIIAGVAYGRIHTWNMYTGIAHGSSSANLRLGPLGCK